MTLFAFFAFALGLVILAAALGIATALHIQFPKIAAWLEDFEHASKKPTTVADLFFVRICLALFIAAGVPIVGGLAYAVSGSSWFITFLGDAGRYYWAWVGGAFISGILAGSFLRPSRHTTKNS